MIDCVCNPFDHKYVAPELAVNTTDPPEQNVVAPAAVKEAVTPGLTVIDAVVAAVQPLAFVIVYVIVAEPAVTPVTTPVVLTVATAVLLDDQVPPVVELANGVVVPGHILNVPVIAATTGVGLTVIDAVVAAVQPLPFVTLYVIVAEPAVTPVTTPVVLTVATAVLLDDQVPPVVELANVVVPPAHTLDVPVIDATTGVGLTVTAVAADVAEQPVEFVIVTE